MCRYQNAYAVILFPFININHLTSVPISFFRYEDINENAGIKVLKSPIQFEPPELDFEEQ